MKAFMITTFADLLLRVALAFFLVPQVGFAGVCYAYPLGWLIGTALSVFLYFSKIWIPRSIKMQIV